MPEQPPSSTGAPPSRQTSPPSSAIEPEVRKLAREAVAKLGVGQFIEDNLKQIRKKLEEFDEYVEQTSVKPGSEGEMTFLALGLPIAHGVIHVGSNRGALASATTWLEKELKAQSGRKRRVRNPDPTASLAVLVFIHAVDRCHEVYASTNPVAWGNILSRVKPLADEVTPADG
ncbi:MAG TPA: hypothetical protein VHG91_08230 [Longimicrobium sp.]|nr:hypothetical protein [Longimicrobium sp.]